MVKRRQLFIAMVDWLGVQQTWWFILAKRKFHFISLKLNTVYRKA